MDGANTQPASTGASAADNDKLLAAVSAIPVVGLIVYLAMKDASPFVKNYSRQGAALFIVTLVMMVVSLIPVIGWLIGCLAAPITLILMIILLIKALQEEKAYRLPVIADIADKIFK